MTTVASLKETKTAIPTATPAVTQPNKAVVSPEKEKAVMTNGRAVTPTPTNNDPIVSVAGKVLTDADMQSINETYTKLEKVDVSGAQHNGSLVISRKAIAVLLPNHPQIYVEGIFGNIVQEARKLLSEPAQAAFDTIIARAKSSFTEKFPGQIYDSAAVQSPKFVAEHGVAIGSFFVSLCEASTKEFAIIQESPEVRKKVVEYLNSTPLPAELDGFIKEIVPSVFFENLRSVQSLNQLLPILKKYEPQIEEYMLALEKDPKCASFQKDVTETITKLRSFQKYLWIIETASGIISMLLWWYPHAEVIETVERYKRLFAGILKRHLAI